MMKSSLNLDKDNKSAGNQLKQSQSASTFQRKQASSEMHIQMAKAEMKKPERTQFQVPAVQKMDEEEELMQGKFEVPPVQRMEEEEEMLQGKFSVPPVQKVEEEEEEMLQGKFNTAPVQRQENSTGMPDGVKSKMESGLGSDFSDVKIHANSSKAPGIGALAHTQDSDIYFAPGQFKPGSSGGQQLLGHELTHVVQQREGRVKPTTEVNGMPVNDNPGLENEADVMGAKLAQAKMKDDKINM